jgi:hypothetical protein
LPKEETNVDTELTPSAAEATLEVVSSEPAESFSPTGATAFDAEGNPLAETSSSPEPVSVGSQQAEAVAEATPVAEDVEQTKAELNRLLQERREIESLIAQRAAAEEQAQAEAYWSGYENELDSWFQKASQVVYQNAQNAYDQSAYIAAEMAKVQAQYADGQRQLRTAREGAIWGAIQAQQYPTYVAQVAQSHGLPPEAVQDLMHLPQGQMEKEAARLAKVYHTIQSLYKENDQLKRSRAAQAVAGFGPGGGRAAGGRIKAGSRDHLMALWGKVR